MPTATPPSPSGHQNSDDPISAYRNAASSAQAADHTSHFDSDMGFHLREKDIRPRVEIILDKERFFLKGTGADVEPTHISGHVALFLKESTSIKELTLQFRGKARIPSTSTEPHNFNHSSSTYLLCSHEWSFLEGQKRHSHTLKAGRHVFPFQLQVGGALPSSSYTDAFGGAGVMYKLRAVAVRPGLSHNLQTVVPVTILRSFASESLEYQQTLEIENTWPGKLMYSIMIPHKAYAVGDTLTAVAKFSPLAKGTSVLSITSSIHENIKLSCKGTHGEHSRVVTMTKHRIVDGRAIETAPSGYSTPHFHTESPTSNTPQVSHHIHSSTRSSGSYFAEPYASSTYLGRDSLSMTSASTSPLPGPSSGINVPQTPSNPGEEDTSADVVTQISITIPQKITPTHSLEPITTSHRIRWSILIGNLDGHTSELRCSLPLHVLDSCLLDEARSFTLASRRLLLAPDEEEAREAENGDEGRELPSYGAHLRDRVANQYLTDATTVRVPNSWVQSGFSPTIFPSASGSNTPSDPHSHTTLPHHPGNGPASPLDWINSELLMSLHNLEEHRNHYPVRDTPPDSNSSPRSRSSSRTQSRRQSRRPSPERRNTDSSATHTPDLNQTITHSSQASRSLEGIFSVTMKPFTSLSGPSHWFSGRSSTFNTNPAPISHEQHNTHSGNQHQHRDQQMRDRGGSQSRDVRPAPGNGLDLGQISLHLAFTEVPDYGIASRGFIGGVPPLSSWQGLPSYDETQQH